MVIAVPDSHPADGIVFLAERGQAGTAHHIASDLRPLVVRQRLVLRRGPHRAMPHRPGEPPRAHRGVRLVQQPEQTPEIPPAILAQRRLQLGRVPPARDNVRVGVLLPPSGTVQVVDERLDALPTRRADLPDHRRAIPDPATGRSSSAECIPRAIWTVFRVCGMPSRPAECIPPVTGVPSGFLPRPRQGVPRAGSSPRRTGRDHQNADRSHSASLPPG